MVNFPVSLEKTFWATTRLVFLGMLLDSENQVVCLPINKVEKGRVLIQSMLNRKKTTLKELQQLYGFLNFLGRAIFPGRAFTRQFYAVPGESKVLQLHHHLRITGEMKMDLKVWKIFLQSQAVFCRPFMDFSKFWKATELDFFTDSSGVVGMGGYCMTEWFYQVWDSTFIQKHNPSIEYLELYAVTTGVLLWIHKFQNKRVVIFTDNESVTNMVNNNTSGCRNCMVLVRLIVLECLIWNVRLDAKFVRSKDNKIADALSRCQWDCFANLVKDKNMAIFLTKIPDQIWPMSKLWIC